MEVPDVSYALSGDVSIAYQVVGEGPPDLVLLPFLSNLYTLWQAPKFADAAYRLAESRRLVVVNPRGVGLSDRPRGFTIESRMDDLRAVMDAVGSERPALLGIAEAAATCAVFAASNPDRVERLILFDPWSRSVLDARERDEELSALPAQREMWGRRDVLEQFAAEINPQWADDPEYLDWFVWHHRLTSSPASWIDFRRMQIELDVGDTLPAIRVPTLVISKERERRDAEEVARRIPGAEYASVPGVGRAIQENVFAVEAIEAFLEGSAPRRIPDTVLSTVLFTDLVGSTKLAAELGDGSGAAVSSGTTRSSAPSSLASGASSSTRRATASSPASTARRVRSRCARDIVERIPSSASRSAPEFTPANASGG